MVSSRNFHKTLQPWAQSSATACFILPILTGHQLKVSPGKHPRGHIALQHPLSTHKNKQPMSCRRRHRRVRKVVVSYLDIEEAQYMAELEEYNAACGDSEVKDPMLVDVVFVPEIPWGQSVSSISQHLHLMTLRDNPQ
ncbi:hypothetical protein C8F04DRAFT_1182508 [Mycena alexandri]|uniref:Uncharacterized protein n=1 Tax=Mycena alexandri TaxID=1745969 RepID=A0AAD6SYU3_9AGAR|nr:hypothetical protein C8F04DRAFT_1182508 [Mycena alexandri]